jgi:hypothetical protein
MSFDCGKQRGCSCGLLHPAWSGWPRGGVRFRNRWPSGRAQRAWLIHQYPFGRDPEPFVLESSVLVGAAMSSAHGSQPPDPVGGAGSRLDTTLIERLRCSPEDGAGLARCPARTSEVQPGEGAKAQGDHTDHPRSGSSGGMKWSVHRRQQRPARRGRRWDLSRIPPGASANPAGTAAQAAVHRLRINSTPALSRADSRSSRCF